MSRLGFLTVGLTVVLAAACNDGPGDHLVGSWTLQSGHTDIQCVDNMYNASTDAKVLDAGSETLTIGRADGELTLTDTLWPDCEFRAVAVGPNVAHVQKVATCASSSSTDSIQLNSGSLTFHGDHLAASLQFTSTHDKTVCASDQTLTF